MINFCVSTFGTEKLSPFHIGLHHFNPPPKTRSYKRVSESLHQRGKSLGVEQCVLSLKDKGMQTQYEREQSKEKNTPNPKKEESIPSMVVNSVMREISLWLGVNHNRRK